MQVSKRLLASGTAVAAWAAFGLAALTGGGDRGPAGTAAACDPQTPGFGVLNDRRRTARLARLDPATLRPRGREVPLQGFLWGSDRSPDGGSAALGVGAGADLQIVDLDRARTAATIKLGRRGATPDVVWARPDRIVARVGTGPNRATIVVADPVRRAIVARHRLLGQVQESRPAGDGLVLVVAPDRAVGPASVAFADAEGGLRVIRLSRIAAGYVPPRNSPGRGDPGVEPAHRRHPGLAVDEAGRRAFVVAAGQPLVAEVDLESGAVSYGELEPPRSAAARIRDWIEPPAHAKLLEGSRRVARWLGGGRLAVSGSDQGADPGEPLRDYGLRIADVERGTLTKVAGDAEDLRFAGGTVVLWSPTLDPRIAAYDSAGERRWRRTLPRSFRRLRLAGCHAYLAGHRTLAVIDLRTGQKVRQVPFRGSLPTFIDAQRPA